MNSELMCKTAKILALEAINSAGSGHSGIVMSAGEIMQTLFERHLNVSFSNKDNFMRDRFVMSAGHGSALYYSYLYILGFISLEDLKNFRKLGSSTPGHPEISTNGVDASTGPLGQGVANAVGMAIAESMLNARFNKYNHYTYCLCGDGCLMEGVALEAISLAGHLGLNKFILLYDKNNCTLDSKLDVESSDDVSSKFISCNFNVIEVNGHNITEIDKAIKNAKKSKDKPTVIICDTIIGKDTDVAGLNKAHGKVLTLEEISQLKKEWGIKGKSFSIMPEVKTDIKNLRKIKESSLKDFTSKELEKFISTNYNLELRNENLDNISTRQLGGIVINKYAKVCPNLISLSADVFSSTKTEIIGGGTYSKENRLGRNIYCGIREHAMASIANGIMLHGGFKVVVSTFLAFADYMRPAIRMSALMGVEVTYVFTHDSVFVGQDGPTHQPVEQIDSLEIIPNLLVVRPCDEKEVIGAFGLAFNGGPTALIMSRQNLKALNSSIEEVKSGAYFIEYNKSAKINLIASGSEVEVACKVAEKLLKEQKIVVNVASAPALKLINPIIEKNSKKLNIVISFGTGLQFLRVFKNVKLINLERFGASGKEEDVLKLLKLDIDSIVSKILNF